MKLNEEIALYEYEIFKCTASEHKNKIQKEFDMKNIQYKVEILPFNARRESNWVSIEDYERHKQYLDKNYTYTVGRTYIEDNSYKRVVLYVSLYKNDNNHALFVYNKKALIYRDTNQFPAIYNDIIQDMLNAIDPYRI